MGRLGFVTNGAFAEYVAVRERYRLEINGFKDALGIEDAAYEAGAVIRAGRDRLQRLFTPVRRFLPGSTVVVYGAGPNRVGCHLRWPSWLAGKIIAFEISSFATKDVARTGCDLVYNPEELARQGRQLPPSGDGPLTDGYRCGHARRVHPVA